MKKKKNENQPPAVTPPESRSLSTTAPKTPSARHEAIYPDENEQERDMDCLVPGNSPLKSGDTEGVSQKELAFRTEPPSKMITRSKGKVVEVEELSITARPILSLERKFELLKAAKDNVLKRVLIKNRLFESTAFLPIIYR